MINEDKMVEELYRMVSQTNSKKLIDVIKDRMREYDISALHLSKLLKIEKSKFNRTLEKIENGDTESIDFYTLLKIAQFLNINMEEASQFFVASLKPNYIGEIESANKTSYVLRRFDLKALKSTGFITNTDDIEAIEERIINFFGLSHIKEYDYEVGDVLFSKVKNSVADKNRELWIRCAHYQFKKLENPNDYSQEKLLALIPKVRPYTRHEEKGFLTVIQALAKIGVTVIVQSYFTKTKVRGGTFVVNGKPCIVITDYNKKYSSLWFALMHELYHVLYDFEALKLWNCHLTGEGDGHTLSIEGDLFNEDMADYFARQTLFPQDKMNYIKHHINNPRVVEEYAKENMIHPSLIYGFYCYEQAQKGKNEFPFYQNKLGSSDKALRIAKTNPWDKETVAVEIEKIKEMLYSINQ